MKKVGEEKLKKVKKKNFRKKGKTVEKKKKQI